MSNRPVNPHTATQISNDNPTRHRQRRQSFQQVRSRQDEQAPYTDAEQPQRRHSVDRRRGGQRESKRTFFQRIANETIAWINDGIVDVTSTQKNTRLYLGDAPRLVGWRSHPPHRGSNEKTVEINILPFTTLAAARFLYDNNPASNRIGILNFASATSPGGGFLSGAQAQEESIARSSTLYVSLVTEAAQPFYALHDRDDRKGFYTHSMIYSPDVYLLRDDDGNWLTPVRVDVLTSPAVNAKDVRKHLRRRERADVEGEIRDVMRERMGRVLALFERKGARQIVLGSFGTGVFQNDVQAMAGLWRELLYAPNARFAHSFEFVVFAIPDADTGRKFALGFYNDQGYPYGTTEIRS